MTAEVAILNKQAVALAADSAATLGTGKIFNSVTKLFELSRSEPVGVMVYNYASIMGVPVETIVKEFRRSKYAGPMGHLSEYAEQFTAFLHEDDSLFSEGVRLNCLLSIPQLAGQRIHDSALQKVAESLSGLPPWGHPTEDEARAGYVAALELFEKEVEDAPDAGGQGDLSDLSAIVSETIVDVVTDISKHHPLDEGILDRTARVILRQFYKDIYLGDGTGIVIAGFGRDDVFPGIYASTFHYSYKDFRKCPVRLSEHIGEPDGNDAFVMPFAQSDVMRTFMNGRDPQYDELVLESIAHLLIELMRAEGSAPEEEQVYEKAWSHIRQNLQGNLDAICTDRFVLPTLEVVQMMPKDELATLAEALVNLTSLKRKASRAQETVGGPTDVAVISKHDGFVWIKRKHYFDGNLNPGFMSRHYGEKK